jgi:hypothetical protein
MGHRQKRINDEVVEAKVKSDCISFYKDDKTWKDVMFI